MKYPILTRSKCSELAERLASGGNPSIDPHSSWVGQGVEVDLKPVEVVAVEIIQRAHEWTDPDRDRFEGKAAAELWAALSYVDTPVLDDRGFWRYLSLRYFWEFIAWREERAFSRGNHLKYVDGTTNTEAVLPRMYLRVHAVGGSDPQKLTASVPKGADFWRSHVIRVRTGSAPALTRAFVSRQASDRLVTNPLREAARRLNRTWTNIVLHMYDDDEAESLIESIWDDSRGS